jgi:ABC-2 type transport system ATP-binding protein
MTTAIEITDVSKRFRLYHEKYQSLKERVIHLGRTPFEEFWALHDVNLEIKEGETVGLLGHNGSGKSTLLKIIAGILQPTTGDVRTVGRVAALLELGAGFHPDLTGRENVFLNGAVLGLPRKVIERRFDEIVAFAELERIIDNQVKHYSSGQFVRLGFAVAVNVEPDILLIDEVLAVGDENFQRKCLDRVKQFQRDGKTIVFVSHSPDLVRMLCDRAAVLDHGAVVGEGAPGVVIRTYREHLLAAGAIDAEPSPEATAAAGDGPAPPAERRNLRIRIRAVDVRAPEPTGHSYLMPGDPLEVRIAYEAGDVRDDVVFGIAIYDVDGKQIFGTSTEILGVPLDRLGTAGEVTFVFESVPLLDGTYFVTVGITNRDGWVVYDWQEQQHQFEVMNPGRSVGQVAFPVHVEVVR